MTWQDTAQSSIRPDRTRKRTLIYTALAVGLIGVAVALRSAPWQGGDHAHVVLETLAAVVAITTGALALLRYYSRKNATLFLIGTGFLVTGLLDAFNAAMTSLEHFDRSVAAPQTIVPWSELASQLFLSILLAWSWIAWVREKKTGRAVIVPERLGYLGVTLATLGSIAVAALVMRPSEYGSSFPLPRPHELIPAGPFLVALGGYLSKGRWRRNPFEGWLVASLIVSVAIHTVFWPFSVHPGDALAQAAHLLKLASYELVLIGLVVSMYGLFKEVEGGAHEIARANVALQEEVAERLRAERALMERRARLELLHTVSKDVRAGMSTDEIIAHAVQALHDHFAEFRAAYCTVDPAGQLHVTHVVSPNGMSNHQGLRSDLTCAPEYLGPLTRGEPFLCDDVRADMRLAPIRTDLEAGPCLAIANWPLRHSTGLRGVICLDSATPHHWTRHEQKALEELANYLAIVLNQALAEGARREAQQALLEKARDLERSNSELEQFAYVASHDLQEPLRMVAGYTQLLARRYRGRLDEEADQFIEYAVDGVTRMQQLIQDLLAYSRVDSCGAEFLPVMMSEVLEWALLNLETAIESSGAIITHGELPAVSGDRTQLGSLLQNLIGNAIKFRGQNPPEIRVGAERRGGEWVFEVRDNGIGIEPEYRDRVFEIFQRLHASEEYEGTGIGLAVSQRIVERHGGRIWVESAPGEGSSFLFTLPAASVVVAA
jgi:signal transduction histidine kinase